MNKILEKEGVWHSLFHLFIYLLINNRHMKANKEITEDEIKKIIELYTKEIKTTPEISKIIGISVNRVNRTLRKNGVEIREKGNIKGKEYHFASPFKQEVKDIDKLKTMFNDCIPVNDIAKELGVGRKAVDRKIKELGLIRPHSMASRDQYDDSKDEEIVRLYNEGGSPNKIASIVGLSRGAVKAHLRHCGIEFRDISQGLFQYNGKEFPKELDDFETLYDMYVIQKLSKKDLAETFKVSPSVIERCLKKFDIHVRGNSEARQGLMVGENHPNWKGGRSGLYSRLREYFRVNQISEVVKRDGGKCQICGSTHKLHVHHIRHFKDIFDEIIGEHSTLDVQKDQEELYDIMTKDSRMNDMDNLITYCKECHLFKVHKYKKHEDK